MTQFTYLQHIDFIKDRLHEIGSTGSFTFATACTERLLPCYARAAVDQQWNRVDVLRSVLNRIWHWLLAEYQRPVGAAAECKAALPPASAEVLPNLGYEIVSAFYGLAATVERDHWHDCFHAADANLGVIEGFLYSTLGLPMSGDSDQIVHSHRLMIDEMERQLDDIRAFSEEGTPAVIDFIRKRATGTSVLSGEWF